MDGTQAARRLTNGGTYTFAELQALCGRAFADRVRALAGVPVEAAPARRVRAPHQRQAAPAEMPARTRRTTVGGRRARS